MLGMETIEFTKDGRLFAANNDGNMYQIDRTTYVATLFALNEQIDGEGLVFEECVTPLAKTAALSTAKSSAQNVEVATTMPTAYALYQSYPNPYGRPPFNPSTTFAFDLPQATMVKLTIYNITGQEVATVISGIMNAGHHTYVWQAPANIVSGVYFYRLATAEFTSVKKMIIQK
jgi:hypothetical protein